MRLAERQLLGAAPRGEPRQRKALEAARHAVEILGISDLDHDISGKMSGISLVNMMDQKVTFLMVNILFLKLCSFLDAINYYVSESVQEFM